MADPRLDDPRIKKDVVRVIAQYLEDEGYVSDHPTHPRRPDPLLCVSNSHPPSSSASTHSHPHNPSDQSHSYSHSHSHSHSPSTPLPFTPMKLQSVFVPAPSTDLVHSPTAGHRPPLATSNHEVNAVSMRSAITAMPQRNNTHIYMHSHAQFRIRTRTRAAQRIHTTHSRSRCTTCPRRTVRGWCCWMRLAYVRRR
jgi:hypothetical protein